MPPPTLREFRERAHSSMQQVRTRVGSLATRSATYVQRRVSAFNEYLSGFKSRSNSDESTTTSERNLSRASSKKKKSLDKFKMGKTFD